MHEGENQKREMLEGKKELLNTIMLYAHIKPSVVSQAAELSFFH